MAQPFPIQIKTEGMIIERLKEMIRLQEIELAYKDGQIEELRKALALKKMIFVQTSRRRKF